MSAEGLSPAPRDRIALAAPLIGAFGLWLIVRPYLGFAGDGRLYLGRALAAADPGGAGRDFMFAGAGQFDFTIFPYLARAMVGLLGLSAASMSLSLAGLALWFVALVVLCRRLAGGHGFVLAVAAVILLPGGYDGVGAFHIGEAQATPRIFAEAFSIFALAGLLAGRPAIAFGLLAAAFCFHPLMGLGAAGAVVIYLCLGDRRWLWLVGAGAAALAAAAVWLRLPLAERLLVQVAPAWRAVIWDRSENILVSHWQASFWSGLAVQAVTIVIAALHVRGRVGRLLWAALATGLAGLAAAWLLGDVAALLLVLQLQVWRALWVTTLASGLAFALIAMGRDGEGERGPGLPLLLLAWMCVDMPPVCLALLAAAAMVWVLNERGRLAPRPLLVNGLWGLALVIALVKAVITAMACLAVAAGRPAGAAAPYQAWEALIDALAIIVFIALILAARWRRPAPPGWALAGAVLVLALGALLWDARSPAQRQAERPATAPALRQLVASRPGEVLWVEGDAEPWIWLGRPSWVSSMHGAGVVFSPQLAATWNERSLRAMRAGLFSPEGRTPFRTTPPVALRPGLDQVRTFCAALDAPAWIVMPDLAADSPLRRLAALRWRAPVATFQPSFAGRILSWRGGRDFFALACGGAPLR